VLALLVLKNLLLSDVQEGGRALCCQVLSLAYVSIRQHTSAYVSIRMLRRPRSVLPGTLISIRQHTSAYVSIRMLRRPRSVLPGTHALLLPGTLITRFTTTKVQILAVRGALRCQQDLYFCTSVSICTFVLTDRQRRSGLAQPRYCCL
jgi:hypothetical protein